MLHGDRLKHAVRYVEEPEVTESTVGKVSALLLFRLGGLAQNLGKSTPTPVTHPFVC